MQANRILTDETYKEIQVHGTADYPIRRYFEDIYLFDFHCIEWHWHPELELIYVLEGEFTAEIGSTRMTVRAGEALLINTNVIHRLEAADHAVIPNAVFLPKLMAAEDSLIYKKYILPVLESDMEYLHLTDRVPWEREAIGRIVKLIRGTDEEDEIGTVYRMLGIWKMICENRKGGAPKEKNTRKTLARTQLQIMMSYIQNNYFRQITLDDIAGTVSLSKSGALNIFHEYLHISPVSYLIQYRLKMAADMLRSTGAHIDAIAYDTGFHNVGYFCRKFKSVYSMTPSEYRSRQD